MSVFVYTELQISVPFAEAPWAQLNPVLKNQYGLLNKTWLSGHGNNSLGGFYEFSDLASAQKFVTEYFPSEAAKFGAPQTTKLFDGDVVKEASEQLNSLHFGGKLTKEPEAFVYTEVQVGVPFEQAPWRDINKKLVELEGLISKTWLSGVGTNTLGGLYAFESLKQANHFATEIFPAEPAGLNAAFQTRVFDAKVVKEASLELNSPFFTKF